MNEDVFLYKNWQHIYLNLWNMQPSPNIVFEMAIFSFQVHLMTIDSGIVNIKMIKILVEQDSPGNSKNPLSHQTWMSYSEVFLLFPKQFSRRRKCKISCKKISMHTSYIYRVLLIEVGITLSYPKRRSKSSLSTGKEK